MSNLSSESTCIILSTSYYPHFSVAAHRASRFAYYLSQFGWNVKVIANEIACNREYDPTLDSDDYSKHVLARLPTPKGNIFSKLITYIIAFARNPLVTFKYIAFTFLGKFPHYVEPSYISGAINAVTSLIAEDPTIVDKSIILATTPSPSTLAAAYEIHKKYSIPWIADFRDTYDIAQQASSVTSQRSFIRYEPSICSTASVLPTVCPALQNHLQSRHTQDICVIPNGFNRNQLNLSLNIPAPPNKKFTIAYTGNLPYPLVNPIPLFISLESLLQAHRIPVYLFEFFYAGPSSNQVSSLLKDYPLLASCSSVNDSIYYLHSLQTQQSANLLLVLTYPADKGVLTFKLCEYLGTGKPILAIPSDDDIVASVLEKSSTGKALSDTNDIMNFITHLFDAWMSNESLKLRINTDVVRSYDCYYHAKTLSHILINTLNSRES